MKLRSPNMINPVYVKTQEDMAWPEEKVFYLISADGLFICRNHAFFKSCVPARGGPRELVKQETFLELQYPKLPKKLLELAVGFLGEVGEKYGAEAALVLAWDSQQYHLLVPRQSSAVYRGHYCSYPLGVHYELSTQLPEGWLIVGDIHSHVDGDAYSSSTDNLDEKYRPGLHIVVGRIGEEPPDFHIETTVDGERFMVDKELIIEGYSKREEVCQKCLDQVQIEYLTTTQGYWDKSLTRNSVVLTARCDAYNGKERRGKKNNVRFK